MHWLHGERSNPLQWGWWERKSLNTQVEPYERWAAASEPFYNQGGYLWEHTFYLKTNWCWSKPVQSPNRWKSSILLPAEIIDKNLDETDILLFILQYEEDSALHCEASPAVLCYMMGGWYSTKWAFFSRVCRESPSTVRSHRGACREHTSCWSALPWSERCPPCSHKKL